MRTFLSGARALAAAAFTTSIFASALVFADYTIVCQGSYLVYKCGNGTTVACVTTDDNGNSYQVDCVAGPGGDHACADYGGYDGVVPSSPAVAYVAAYRGRLPLQDLTGDGEPNSTATASLVATCADGVAFTCDDEETPCPKSHAQLAEQCASSGGLAESTVYIAFTPLDACSSVAIDLDQDGQSDCCQSFSSAAAYVTAIKASCKKLGPPAGFKSCNAVLDVAKQLGDLSGVCPSP